MRTSAAAPDDRARLRELVWLLDRDQHDDGVGVSGGDPARRLDAADAGHAHVEEHQLGVQALDGRQRLLAGLSLAERLEPGVAAMTSLATRRKTA